MVVVSSIPEAGALRGRVVTVGNFDGVHRGHQHLLAAARRLGDQLGTGVVVVTFDPAPRDVLRPDNGIPRIQSLDRKLAHLARHGVDGVLVVPFDRATAALEPEVFAADVLGGALGVRGVVVGHDFRFGRGRRGDAALLRRALEVPVEEVPPCEDAGGPVSSSRVRACLAAADVRGAAALLGRPHELVGDVVAGDRRGRTIGFPTANLEPQGGMLPPDGVYAVEVQVPGQGRVHGGVANLGVRPTFGAAARRLEVHVFEFAGDLYGRRLVVGLRDHLRPERRFSGVDELVAQIRADATDARTRLAG